MREILVGANEAGQRLDKLTIKFLPLASKGFIYKMIRKKNITLNDKKCEGNEIVKEGDSLKLWLADDTIAKFQESKPAFTPSNIDPEVIYEDKDIIIFNKPAGILSQKAKPQDISMNEVLIEYLINNKILTEEDMLTFRPSICNRLDRNTSGLIICGKSLKGLQEMAALLKERTAHKDYIAFVKGSITEGRSLKGSLSKDRSINKVTVENASRTRSSDIKTGTYQHSRSEGDGIGSKSGDAEYIETDYKPLWTDGKTSILIVRLITGKTHQIRAHLASIGHPILGDMKYGDGKGAGRQLLHAYRLTLPDNRTFIAPLPEDMKWELGKPEAFEDLPWRI